MKKFLRVILLAFLLCFSFGCRKDGRGITEEEAGVLFDQDYKMWNEGNLEVVDEIIAPEYVIYSDPYDPYENQTLDHAAYKKRLLEVRAATPDIRFSNEGIIVKGDKVVNRWTMSGTNKRTGRQFSVTGMTIYQVEDGKLKGHWQNVDKLGLYRQLGFTLTPPELEELKAQEGVAEANGADLKKLAENFQRAWDNRDMNALVQLYAEDATMFTPGAQEPMQGREAIKKNEEALLRAMPDSRLEFTLVLILEDHVVFEFIARGTFTGPLASPEGDIPPTGKSLRIKVAEIVRVNADGLIGEDRTYYDTMEFMRQLGLIEQSS